jgi:ankyrin repeat protein
MKDDGDLDEYDGETEEEGEVILPRQASGRRREVIVTEIRESEMSENNVFGNEVDLRREILEGIVHSMCRQGDLAETRNLLNENPQLQYSRGNSGDLLTHEAVLSDNESLLSYLLNEKSFDANLPNDVHAYPLHYAVLSGSLRMVTILVNHRAFVDCVDGSKKTPLMAACEEEDHDIAELLLDRGASTITQDASGNKPIHFAVKSRAQACLRRLVSSDADVNAVNHMHETPLFIACKFGFHGVSRTLLRAGADPEKANKFGTTPLDEASSNGSSSLVDLLRGYV